KKGDVINVPIPVAQVASDVVPSNTPPVPASNTPDVVQIPLDNWKHSDFHLTDKDLVQIDRNEHFFPMQAEEAVKALANAVNIDIFDEYKGVFGLAGVVTAVPFATGITEATDLRKTLNKQLCPLDQRRVVLNFDAEANALTQSAFRDTSQSGKSQVVQQG